MAQRIFSLVVVGLSAVGSLAHAQLAPPASLPPPAYVNDPAYAQPTQVYVQPAPTYGAPQPVYQPYPQQPYQPYPPSSYRPVMRRAAPIEPWRPQLGLGLRFSGVGQWNSAASHYSQGGIGLELLFRVHRRVTLELSAQYLRVGDTYVSDGYYAYPTGPLSSNGTYYDRYDVPILAGLRYHFTDYRSVLAPYLVGAAGVTYARLYPPESYAYESHWFTDVAAGLGLEIRGGRHFYLSFDIRGFGRFRGIDANDPSEGAYVDGAGGSVPAMGNQGGIQFHCGIGGYF